ncbi:serine hydrolase domain-containing protein [Fluviispira sanaruensis]|uniref:Beta-lactamase-related domain-containing protein n=1 Tax=Fluviispira sanaruensis TaxID=2493639 RepID=A0A4P2VKH2_FLUSA|nr:serine hydrolase domain-containing protein [Fluviispira sanaruensis]BBH53746.1 hypothetical protein JCM31447_21940 [Fluviispira sanaruensis]
MNKFFKLLINTALIINAFYNQKTFSQTKKNKEIRSKIQSFINDIESEKNQQQGFALAILYKGNVIYKTTSGFQKGNKKPITYSTLFPLASLSKTVSATSIALMVEQGKINLDKKFKLPYLKNPVNFTNILSHSTGYHFSGNNQIEQGISRAKLLNILKTKKPNCKPGNCFLYSNATFSLIEEALNLKKLNLNFLIQNLNKSLNTQEIKLLKKDITKNIAYPHKKVKIAGKNKFIPQPFPPYYPKITPASAGIFASINGMIEVYKLAFGYKPNLISKATAERMTRPVILNKKVFKLNIVSPDEKRKLESYYALGWRVLKEKNKKDKDLIYHPGYINGIKSFIGFIPSKDLGIIILTNQESKFASRNGFNFWKLATNDSKFESIF